MPDMTAQEAVEATLGAATTAATVVAVEESATVNYRWAVSMPTTNGDTRERKVTITAISEVSGGWATGTRSGSIDDWRALLAAAEADARGGSASSEGAELLPGGVLAGYAAPPAAPPTPELPSELAAAFGRGDTEVFGYAEQEVATTYVGTSTGARWRSEEGAARFEVSAKADGRRRSSWHGAAGDTFANVDVAAALADVESGLAAQATSIDVPAEPTTVILTPSAVADLMIVLWWVAVARDAAEGHSPFSDPEGPAGTALGRRLTDRRLTLHSDPAAAGVTCPDRLWTPWSGPSATVFDTGSPLVPQSWITDGRLSALAATRAAAAQFGLPFVASPANLLLHDEDGSGSLADVVARTERALLVTSLWYIRDVDPQAMLVTGLTRDGTYVVEEGRIVGSAGNFRFNESPLAVLANVVDAGEPVRCLPREWADYFTRTVMPPLVVRKFGLSTPSTAI